MQVLILTFGSRGDVQPYIALAVGLRKAGHSVTLGAPPNFASLAKMHRVDFSPIGQDSRDATEKQIARLTKGMSVFNAPFRIRTILQMVVDEIEQITRQSMPMCENADVVVYHFAMKSFALTLSEHFRVPFIGVDLMPLSLTGEFAPAVFPPVNFGRHLNKACYTIMERIIWWLIGGRVNRWRREQFHYPSLTFKHSQQTDAYGSLRLNAFSPTLVTPPNDWGTNVKTTGYWFLPPADDWEPSAALTAFLSTGPPPVYIGFGSIASKDRTKMTDIIIRTMELVNRRCILLSGWGGFDDRELPDTFLRIQSVPHEWLFPRMAVVVHHGGAGTTAAGLRAGVPSVVIPSAGDQPFWAHRLHKLGVGSRPLTRRQLTAQKLANAIQYAMTDTVIQRAKEIGEKIRSEDGIGQAIDIIEHLVQDK